MHALSVVVRQHPAQQLEQAAGDGAHDPAQERLGQELLELVGLLGLPVEAAEIRLGVVGCWRAPGRHQPEQRQAGAGDEEEQREREGHQMSTFTMRRITSMPSTIDPRAPPSQTHPHPSNMGSR